MTALGAVFQFATPYCILTFLISINGATFLNKLVWNTDFEYFFVSSLADVAFVKKTAGYIETFRKNKRGTERNIN